VGIIFLSSMASSIAANCSKAGLGASVVLGTTLLTFSIATFFVGLLTLLVGECTDATQGPGHGLMGCDRVRTKD
jgi:hypothetical protein